VADPGVVLGTRFDRALDLAVELHRRQARKGPDRIPYVAHLLGVSSLVLEDGGDEDEAIGALLHDVIEDHGKRITLADLEAEFGPRVARIVDGCTDAREYPKPPWRARKEAYIARLESEDESVQRVALADKLYNVRETLLDYREHGQEVFERFDPEADTVWYYRALFDVFRKTTASPLVAEFGRAVDELETLAD